jgi:ring-1,2-phenylacetyl-CoA epoxidase subunit PaaD
MTIEQGVHIDEVLFPILEKVSDPEIPVLSILEMGVVRSAILKDNHVHVKITPHIAVVRQWM